MPKIERNRKMQREITEINIKIPKENAKLLAFIAVKNQFLTEFERSQFNLGILKLRTTNCFEEKKKNSEPAWFVDVQSYTLKSPLLGETNENIQPQKKYPFQVWREKERDIDNVELRGEITSL